VDPFSPFTELPFASPGRVFRSRMPFDTRDPQGELLKRFIAESVDVVVVLVDDAEALECTGRDLRGDYQAQGMSVIHLPIPDFETPSLDTLDEAVMAALQDIRSGKNLAVHCHAGLGRTGLFLACLAQRDMQMGAGKSIDWVRSFVPGALESPKQVLFALDYGELRC
jgi:protein-tyrosine phosphatase